MVKPISPQEVAAAKAASFPDAVFEAFNAQIAANFVGNKAKVPQEAIVVLIAEALDIPRQEVFDKGYLNVEEAYKAEGWKVVYDKPAYNESYGAFFEFSRA